MQSVDLSEQRADINTTLPSDLAAESEDVRPSGGAARFLAGSVLLVLAAAVVLALVQTTFDPADRLVPSAFVVVETMVSLCGLWQLRGVGRNTFLSGVRDEWKSAAGLGAAGAALGDTLLLLRQRRQDLTSSFLEVSGGWSNLLVMAGMVGTAGYLVSHAGSFVIGDKADLSLSLAKLLALAPKAFAATGLALLGALVVQVCSAGVLRHVEESASTDRDLCAAWRAGRASSPSDEQEALARAVGAAIDERIVARLEMLPERLDRVAQSSEQSVQVMAQTVTSLASNLESIGARLSQIGEGMTASGTQVESVLAAFHALSAQSQRVVDQLSQTQELVSRTTAEAIEKMQKVLDKYQAQMFEEVSRTAPDFVGKALSGATDEFTRKIREHGNQIETTIQTIAHASFGQATLRFSEAVSSTSEAVGKLGAQLEKADLVLGRLGGLLDVAAKTWDPQVAQAKDALDKLSSSFERLGGASAPAPGSVERLCESLERSSRALSEQAQLFARQSRALGEIEGLLAAGRGGRS